MSAKKPARPYRGPCLYSYNPRNFFHRELRRSLKTKKHITLQFAYSYELKYPKLTCGLITFVGEAAIRKFILDT